MSLMKEERGFTVFELLLGMCIGMILLTTVYGILDSVMKSYALQSAQADAQSGAQLAMLKMTREIRQSEKPLLAVYSSPGHYEYVVFKADMNNDGTSEAVRYMYNNYTRQLTRTVNTTGVYNFDGRPEDTVASDVRNSVSQAVFTYYGTSLATPLDPTSPSSDIINKAKLVKLQVVVDKDPNKPPSPISLTSEVKLRNFGY